MLCLPTGGISAMLGTFFGGLASSMLPTTRFESANVLEIVFALMLLGLGYLLRYRHVHTPNNNNIYAVRPRTLRLIIFQTS